MKVHRSREEPGCSEMIIKVKSDIQSTYKGQNEGSTSPVGPPFPKISCFIYLILIKNSVNQFLEQGRGFFLSTGGMIGSKRHHITPYTRSTRFKRLFLTLAIYHPTLSVGRYVIFT